MSDKVQKLIEELKTLSLVEAAELVKAIEETFDVSAAAPVAAMAAPVAGVAGPVEEKTEFTVKVTEFAADKKIAVIKVVKNALGIGLGEAKAKVEEGSFVLVENVKKEEADKFKEELVAAGASVTLE